MNVTFNSEVQYKSITTKRHCIYK